MKRIWVVIAAALTVVLSPAPAAAAWIRAETDRFVVYGEGNEARVRAYVAKLTTFDAVLRTLYPVTKDRTPQTKLQVILVNGDLKRIDPQIKAGISGFYTARADGLFAFVETETGGEGDDVLFHEYAHHFMLENFPAAYPAWFVEGFAEYFMTADIAPKTVKIGGYNLGRAYQVLTEPWIGWDELLSKTTGDTRWTMIQSYYAQAWLLVHYMQSSPERAKKLDATIKSINEGVAPAKAFWTATGWDERKLTRQLRAYTRLSVFVIENPLKSPPAVAVTQMPKSADDLFLDRMRLYLRRGSDADFLAQVRRHAARYPVDAFADLTLARAEFAMGDIEAGEAIMRRRLELQPNDFETLLAAGVGKLVAAGRDKERRVALCRAARPFLGKAYALNKDDYRVLSAFSEARAVEPSFPNDNDVNVLTAARDLAPSETELSLRTGLVLLKVGRRDEAQKVLAPVANNPHGGAMALFAKALMDGKSQADAEAAAKAVEGVDDPTGAPPA